MEDSLLVTDNKLLANRSHLNIIEGGELVVDIGGSDGVGVDPSETRIRDDTLTEGHCDGIVTRRRRRCYWQCESVGREMVANLKEWNLQECQ